MKAPERKDSGFTLVELIIVIVVLGIVAAVGIPKIGDLMQSSRVNATRAEMNQLRRAIVGNAEVIAGGTLVNRGFLGDVGFVPGRLEDLVTRPDTVPPYSPATGFGWNGPYIDVNNDDYLTDAWDSAYVYEPSARRVSSTGSGETLTMDF